jgi:hypothetical protein
MVNACLVRKTASAILQPFSVRLVTPLTVPVARRASSNFISRILQIQTVLCALEIASAIHLILRAMLDLHEVAVTVRNALRDSINQRPEMEHACGAQTVAYVIPQHLRAHLGSLLTVLAVRLAILPPSRQTPETQIAVYAHRIVVAFQQTLRVCLDIQEMIRHALAARAGFTKVH